MKSERELHLENLVRALRNKRISVDAIHDYGCPITRIGRKHGPCNCGGDDALEPIKTACKALNIPIIM